MPLRVGRGQNVGQKFCQILFYCRRGGGGEGKPKTHIVVYQIPFVIKPLISPYLFFRPFVCRDKMRFNIVNLYCPLTDKLSMILLYTEFVLWHTIFRVLDKKKKKLGQILRCEEWLKFIRQNVFYEPSPGVAIAACGAMAWRGPGSRRFDFRDLISPVPKSRYESLLK